MILIDESLKRATIIAFKAFGKMQDLSVFANQNMQDPKTKHHTVDRDGSGIRANFKLIFFVSGIRN